MSNCLACERIQSISTGHNPYFLIELKESYVVLADDQRYEGYCLLLLKQHHEHLGDLSRNVQLRLFEDVMLTAKALNSAFTPARLNYECLGNTLHHIHWHVIPRYDWDPDPKCPIWMRPVEERQVGVSPEKLSQLRQIILRSFHGEM